MVITIIGQEMWSAVATQKEVRRAKRKRKAYAMVSRALDLSR